MIKLHVLNSWWKCHIVYENVILVANYHSYLKQVYQAKHSFHTCMAFSPRYLLISISKYLLFLHYWEYFFIILSYVQLKFTRKLNFLKTLRDILINYPRLILFFFISNNFEFNYNISEFFMTIEFDKNKRKRDAFCYNFRISKLSTAFFSLVRSYSENSSGAFHFFFRVVVMFPVLHT